VDSAQPIGRSLNRDIGRGESAEKQIDAFISHRHEKRVASHEGERAEEAAWRETEKRHAAQRRARNRLAWHEYHLAAAERHKAVLASLVAYHEGQAEMFLPKGAA